MEDDVIEELNDGINGEVLDSNASSFPSKSSIKKEKINNTVEKSEKEKNVKSDKDENKTGKEINPAGKSAEVAGKAVENVGKGTQKVGNAISSGGKAVSAIPGVGAPLGGALNAAGKGINAVGRGTEKAGKSVNNAGKRMQNNSNKAKKNSSEITNRSKQISDTNSRIKTSSKKGKVSNKLFGSGKNNETSSESFTDKAKNFINKKREEAKANIKSSDSTGTILGDKIKKVGKILKMYAISIMLFLVLMSIIIYMIFSPILDAIQWLDDKWDSISTVAENTNNLYAGFGYQNTKEAFFEELNYLYGEYDEQLDVPLIMATLFYKEREGYDTLYSKFPADDSGDIDELNSKDLISEAKSFIKSKYKDMYETLDEEQMNYTVGKIYRLRKLARHQLDTSLFGAGGLPTTTEEVSFSEFLTRVKDRMGDDLYQLFESIPSSIGQIQDFFRKVYELVSIADGSETLSTTSFGNWGEISTALTKLLKETILTGTEFGNIHFDLTDMQFKVTIFKYDYNEDNYKKYLKDYYLQKMPEFSEDIAGLTGAEKDRALDKLISNIYEYSNQFKQIYGYVKEGSSEEFSEECVGNLSEALVPNLTLPIAGASTYSFSGSSAYGISNGVTNNGVDLTNESAGVKEGDDVYSIALGKVIEVESGVTCNIKDDESCSSLGNYVKIEHTISADNQKFKIVSVYANLQAGSVKLKKNDSVKKGDVIGKIGSTGAANNTQLHFEIHDVSNGDVALNPTNLFISCSVSTSELVGDTNEEKIWFYLTKIGKFSKKQAASIMGNLSQESGFMPNNLENSSNQKAKITDEEFTNLVNKGTITKSEFVTSKVYGVYKNNAYGYGLAQWTSPGRKENLYNLRTKKKTNIDDLTMQLEFLTKELNSNWCCARSGEKSKWMKDDADLADMTKYLSKGFEGAGIPNNSNRISVAKQIYDKYKDKEYKSNISMDNIASSEGETKAKDWSNEKKIKYLFPNGVPKSESELKKYLVDVTVPITTKDGKTTTTTVTVHKAIADDVKAALTAAQNEGFVVYEIGGYRKFGSDDAGKVKSVDLIYSQHCYGLAVDINVNENCYKKPANGKCSVGKLYSESNKYSIKKSGALYKSFISNGWGWGGEWSSLKDYMHFSFFGV